ncbi:MAG: glycosyltransferase family 4 protein [Kiritimatiellaeota bacterium]|nr:glycosyltransferase family 4 protein [Kiritimatiellota bacterium]
MKIAHIIASSEPGGMENHLVTLCNALSKTCQVSVIAPTWRAGTFAPEVKVIAFDGLTSSRYNPIIGFKLWRLLEALSPDIVHAHGTKSAILVSRPCFKAYARVATVHGIKKHTYTFSFFDHIIAVSQIVADSLRPYPATVVYNGIHIPDAPLPPPCNTPPLALAIGRLAPVKGFDDLIAAWTRVNDAHLQIAGDGPSRPRLESLIARHNLQHRVKMLGAREDIAMLLNACDLAVISSHREGASLVFAEALAHRRPVVSTDCGLMSGLMKPSQLVTPKSPIALASKINAALADLPAYSATLAPLYDLCRREMTVEAMAQKTLAVYHAFARARPAAPHQQGVT